MTSHGGKPNPPTLDGPTNDDLKNRNRRAIKACANCRRQHRRCAFEKSRNPKVCDRCVDEGVFCEWAEAHSDSATPPPSQPFSSQAYQQHTGETSATYQVNHYGVEPPRPNNTGALPSQPPTTPIYDGRFYHSQVPYGTRFQPPSVHYSAQGNNYNPSPDYMGPGGGNSANQGVPFNVPYPQLHLTPIDTSVNAYYGATGVPSLTPGPSAVSTTYLSTPHQPYDQPFGYVDPENSGYDQIHTMHPAQHGQQSGSPAYDTGSYSTGQASYSPSCSHHQPRG